jgi:hypothetical protein
VAGGYTVKDREWTQQEFEKRILRPVFAHAKHVKIIDRYVGGRGNRRGIGDDYRRSLNWMLEVFMNSALPTAGRSFEVYCGLYSAPHSNYGSARGEEFDAVRESLRSFEKEKRDAGAPLTIIIKRESPEREMPHARHLLTDQVALLVERGFDLLWTDRKMKAARLRPGGDPRPVKDISIHLCHNPEQVEESVRMLPTLL